MLYAFNAIAMSSPALDFDITVLIQTGLFLFLMIIVDNALVRPYLRARDEREGLTEGAREAAKQVLLEAETLKDTYLERKQLAMQEVETERRIILTKAREEADLIVNKSREAVKKEQTIERETLRRSLDKARADSDKVLDAVSQDICRKLLA